MNAQSLPSNRSFGVLFTIVFAACAGLAWWHGNDRAAYAFVGMAVLVGLVTLVHADWLEPFNRAWMWLAYALNKVVSPVVLGVMYFGVITPFALLMRLAGRDPMRRHFERATSSYWIKREPPGPPPDSLRDQF
jgi:hypothetical protein